MSAPPENHAAPTPRAAAAWTFGGLAALAASGLAFGLTASPVGAALRPFVSGDPIRVVAPATGFAAALVAGLGAVWVGTSVQPGHRVVGLLTAAALLTLSQGYVLALHGVFWEPLPALLAVLSGGLTALLLRPEQAGPATWFRHRVSPQILSQLAATPDPAFLRPDQRKATVLSCRLVNENALREVLPARDFLKLCESFRAQAAALLRNRGACLDPTEATGVRAFFGLPLERPGAADEAVAAALALDAAMLEFAAQHATPAGPPACGIGLATGKLTAGLVDGTYRVLGDAMELSRWLAAETANYEVRLLTDNATHLAADLVEDRPLEFVNPPEGAAVEIFQLLGTLGSLSQEALARRQAFRDAIMLLRAGHAGDALCRFGDAKANLTTPDPVLESFIATATDQTLRDAASTGPNATVSPMTEPTAEATPALPASESPPILTPPPVVGACAGPAAPAPRRKGKAARKIPRRP